MRGFNLPDNISYSDPEAPWNQTRESVQDEQIIIEALAWLDELVECLTYLDRHKPQDSHFNGFRGGADADFDAYRALRIIGQDLKEMLSE